MASPLLPPTLRAQFPILAQTIHGQPLAYLLGEREFLGRPFRVEATTLIPRPETEAMLEWVTGQELPSDPIIVDACTGTGALALALAQHRPSARVMCSSPRSLARVR